MNSHVVGIREGTDHEIKLNAVKALHAAELWELPEELQEYFNCIETGEVLRNEHSGLEVKIEKTPAVEKHNADMQDGFVVDLTKLPKEVTKIKFYNSY